MAIRHSKILKITVTSVLFMVSLLSNMHCTAAQIGVTYGSQGNNLPSKQRVVDIYRANGIGRMRIYFPDHEILQALQGSGIQLLLDVPNDQIQNFAQNPSLAVQWVQQNVAPYASVINYLAVGNEVDQNQKQYVGPALQNTLNALRSTNSLADRIKVTTAIGMSEIINSSPPSAGEFKDLRFMDPIVNFLKENDSPLMLNVYPYFAYRDNKAQISLDYALFTSPGTVTTDPNGLQYQNLYDALVDSVYAALEKRGASNGANKNVITSETGWSSPPGPGSASRNSTGVDNDSRDNAGTYYHNMASHARKGTPRKPGRAEVYLFAMFDENQKPGDIAEKNFGIFNPDGQPKYPGIDFGA